MINGLPDTKPCEKCGHMVRLVYKPKTITMTIEGKPTPIEFQAGYCAECGTVACERDFDRAFVEAIKKAGQE